MQCGPPLSGQLALSPRPQGRTKVARGGVGHNFGHKPIPVGAESRPFPAHDVALSGEKMPGKRCRGKDAGGTKSYKIRGVKKRKLFELASFCALALWPRHPPDSAGEAGNGRGGAYDTVAEVMIKPKLFNILFTSLI